jgi:hypothetical protein
MERTRKTTRRSLLARLGSPEFMDRTMDKRSRVVAAYLVGLIDFGSRCCYAIPDPTESGWDCLDDYRGGRSWAPSANIASNGRTASFHRTNRVGVLRG